MKLDLYNYSCHVYSVDNMVNLVVCGAINWDTTCFTEHLPLPGEEVCVTRVSSEAGGTGSNVAVAAAQILGAGQVALIAALGEDDIAHRQIVNLETKGVNASGIRKIPAESSGQAYIMVDQKGQNIIASYLGANAKLTIEHLHNPATRQLLQQCQGIILTDPPLDVASQVVAWGERQGIPILWDPGILLNQGISILQPLIGKADVIFLNEAESSVFLGTAEWKAALKQLKHLGFTSKTVLKRGSQGAILLDPTTDMVIEISALPLANLGLHVVNAVGCGDVFAGAFAAYYNLGIRMERTLTLATIAAGINVTSEKTQGSPSRENIERIYQHSQQLKFAARKHSSSTTE